MDSETKIAFASVDTRLDKIDDQLTRAATLLNRLADEVSRTNARLDAFAERITADIGRLTGRLDAFAEVVVRGFTDSAG